MFDCKCKRRVLSSPLHSAPNDNAWRRHLLLPSSPAMHCASMSIWQTVPWMRVVLPSQLHGFAVAAILRSMPTRASRVLRIYLEAVSPAFRLAEAAFHSGGLGVSIKPTGSLQETILKFVAMISVPLYEVSLIFVPRLRPSVFIFTACRHKLVQQSHFKLLTSYLKSKLRSCCVACIVNRMRFRNFDCSLFDLQTSAFQRCKRPRETLPISLSKVSPHLLIQSLHYRL